MSKISVSVIVPVYNKEMYLKECLDSIVNQTLETIEIIIVDDGSTDNSKVICEKHLSDKRVRYYYQKNEGLASARQTGIELSKGEYIGFIDADDWIEPDMFEKMYSKAKEYCADIVLCNRYFNNENHKPTTEIKTGFYNREGILKNILPQTLAYIGKSGDKRVISWSNCRRIFRKQLLIDNNIAFDRRFRRSQDLQLTYESTLCANGLYCMGEDYFYHIRSVGDSLSRGYTKNMWDLYIPLIERLYKDTEDFKELDLMDQMHLRAFFFATDCIENEMKPLCPNDKKTKIRLINEIMNDPICERFYGHIPVEKLSPLYRKYYELIHKKKAARILSFTKSYNRRQEFRRKYISPIIHFLTETAIYKKIRGK